MHPGINRAMISPMSDTAVEHDDPTNYTPSEGSETRSRPGTVADVLDWVEATLGLGASALLFLLTLLLCWPLASMWLPARPGWIGYAVAGVTATALIVAQLRTTAFLHHAFGRTAYPRAVRLAQSQLGRPPWQRVPLAAWWFGQVAAVAVMGVWLASSVRPSDYHRDRGEFAFVLAVRVASHLGCTVALNTALLLFTATAFDSRSMVQRLRRLRWLVDLLIVMGTSAAARAWFPHG